MSGEKTHTHRGNEAQINDRRERTHQDQYTSDPQNHTVNTAYNY